MQFLLIKAAGLSLKSNTLNSRKVIYKIMAKDAFKNLIKNQVLIPITLQNFTTFLLIL